MLVMVGIDTEFGMLEGVVTPLIDMRVFPNVRKEILSGKLLSVGQKNNVLLPKCRETMTPMKSCTC